jgi:arylsulfatase A-like enzyme
VTEFPACAVDIVPTLVDVVALPASSMLEPQDGMSLAPLFGQSAHVPDPPRSKPIPFNYTGQTALLDNNYKLLHVRQGRQPLRFELYDLRSDPSESDNLIDKLPEVAGRMRKQMSDWKQQLQVSIAGGDYPEKEVSADHPQSRAWTEVKGYEGYLDAWSKRPEYRQTIERARRP